MRQGSRGVKAETDAKRVVGASARKPPKAKVQAKRLVAKKAPKRTGSKDRQSEKRLAEALQREKAIDEILRVMSVSPGDVQPVLEAVAARAAHLCDAPYANVMIRDGEMLRPSAFSRLPERTSPLPLPVTRGSVNGRAVLDRKIIHHADIVPLLDTEYPDARQNARRLGHRTVLAVPLLREGEACGTITVYRREPRPFSPEHIALVETFARQAVIAIQNTRMFREIEIKSRELETASRHKSEFLANMSHELRTPLNAIIGFSELLAQRMFGEINDKQAEYLGDILESGQHLLSLINDILDLSKIEAGRMELEPTEFDLPSVIENTLILIRERAQRHGITLGRTVDERLKIIRGDERKVKQVLLNLLSNALKFTPASGQIDVRAELRDGAAEISVRDTGMGIAPEDQEAVFEEFRQVGTVSKKVEGTGLGLAISRKFVELHGGRIWVKSQVGSGSTFTFTLPVINKPRHEVS